MKVNTIDLKSLLNIVSSIDRTGIKDILKYIRMVVSGNLITFHSTNTNVYTLGDIECADNKNDYDICIPYREFKNIVDKMDKSKDTEIKVLKSKIKVSQESVKFQVKHVLSDDFPNKPNSKNIVVSFSDSQIKEIRKKVSFYEPWEAGRFFESIKLFSDNEKIYFHSTNSKSGSIFHIRNTTNNIFELTIPAEFFHKSLQLLSKSKSSLYEFYVDDDNNYVMISAGKERVYIRLMKVKYPDLNRIIPKDLPLSFEFKASEVKEIINRCQVLEDDVKRMFCMEISDKSVLFSSVSDNGDYEENIACNIEGNQANINRKYYFHSQLFKELITSFNDDKVKIEMSSPRSAVKLTSLNEDYYIGFIAPMVPY